MEWRVGNLLQGLGNEEGAERFETMVRGAGARIERIVSWGQASPEGFWYEQGWDEWVLVVQGVIFVIVVMLFRKGIVGEIADRLGRKS